MPQILPETIGDYFLKSDAIRTLVLEIERNNNEAKRFYLSDGKFQTGEFDTPANAVFSPVIEEMPNLVRKLADPFEGSGSVSYGTITLAKAEAVSWLIEGGLLDVDGDGTLLDVGDGGALSMGDETGVSTMTLKRGASIVAKVAAPSTYYRYADAMKLFTGQVARISGDSTGRVKIEVRDRSAQFRSAIIPVTATRPRVFGRCRNVSPVLVDSLDLIYGVQGPISAVTAVYDDGVQLADSQWTADLDSGDITLNIAYEVAGTITMDIDGEVVDGEWLSTTAQIAARLIDLAGQSIEQDYGLVNDGMIGLLLTEPTELGPLLTGLFRGAASYWLIDEDDAFRADSFPVPSEGGATIYDASQLIGEAEFQEEDRIHRQIRFSYRRNWTRYQSKPGASQTQADFSQLDSLQSSVQSDDPDDELVYQDAPLLETYFDAAGAAANCANRLLRIYEVQRNRATVVLPYSATRRLGDDIALSFGDRTFFGVIVGLSDAFDGTYPTQPIEVLA